MSLNFSRGKLLIFVLNFEAISGLMTSISSIYPASSSSSLWRLARGCCRPGSSEALCCQIVSGGNVVLQTPFLGRGVCCGNGKLTIDHRLLNATMLLISSWQDPLPEGVIFKQPASNRYILKEHCLLHQESPNKLSGEIQPREIVYWRPEH